MSELATTTTATIGTATPGETKEFENCTIVDVDTYNMFDDPEGMRPEYCIGCKVNLGNGQEEMIYLEVSNDYGKGFNSQRTQIEITFETLKSLGYEGTNNFAADYGKLKALVGKPCRVFGKVSTKGFWNYYFSSGRRRTRVSSDALAARMARLMGQQAAPAAAPAPDVNPFN